MKNNHETVIGKLLRTDKQFRHLKPRQKEKINSWLYEAYCRLWIETGREPHEESNHRIVAEVMERITAAEIWIPEPEVVKYFNSQKNRFRNRFERDAQQKAPVDTQ